MKNKKILAALAAFTLVSGNTCIVEAEINEKPIAGKHYNDYVSYDANGTQDFSLQGSVKGEKHDYYFNEGATLDASNGTTHSAILAHNWLDFDTETAENFHIGKGKDFIIKSYLGRGALEAQEGATLSIVGGKVMLESGITSTGGMDNTNSAIHMESSGVLKIDAESLWIRNNRADRQNVGAISMAGDSNTIDIDVEKTFTAEQVDMGLALQTQENGSMATAHIQAGGDITIRAQRSDGGSASGYRGAGIYSLAYHAQDSESKTSLISDNGNITIDAQGDGVYAYGNTPTTLRAQNGEISLHSKEKHGIYSKGYFDTNTNTVKLSAQKIKVVSDANYGLYSNNSQVVLQGKTIQIENTKDSRGVHVTENGNVTAAASQITFSGGKYGVSGSNSGHVTANADMLSVIADDGWSVCLFSGATANFTAKQAQFYEDLYVKASEMNAFADKNNVFGQARALEGGIITFDSKDQNGTGCASVVTTGKDAVTASSDVYESDNAVLSEIHFKQASYINSQGDESYHADKQGVRTIAAVRALRNSKISLDKAAGIYGDIIAGKGPAAEGTASAEGDGGSAEPADWKGGSVTINSVSGAEFKGDVLAGNKGSIDFTLNYASYEGRVDDYADATLKDMVFRPQEFDVDVTEGGTVNMTLNHSTWTARGQNFVTTLAFGEEGGLVDLSKDENNSVTIRNLKGDGTFNMLLNSEDHSKSDMLYIGNNEGSQTINVVGGITGGLEKISRDNPLRFATVGIDTDSDVPEVKNSGIRAYTRDAGALDVEYSVEKEKFNKDDAENEKYNGAGNGEGVDKPGNDFVEEELVGDRNAENWIITGVKQAQTSDAGKTVIAMSKVNYSNAVYMDRLNKRMGEARFIEGDDGLWVRLRHDRIGKSDAFRSKNTMFEIGYDWKDNDQKDGTHYRGFAFDYMRGTADYTNVLGEGDVRRAGLWYHDTWMGDKGHYTDYVVKYGRLSNDFDIYGRTTGEKISGDYDNDVWSVSAEYGRKKDLGNDWYIEPQAQLQYAYVTDASYTTSQETKVDLDSIDSLIGRAGFRLGRDTDEANTVYFKADILHEFLGGQSIRAMDNTGTLSTTYENEGTWYDVGFGFSHRMSEDKYMFLDVEKLFGNDNEDTYQVNIGLNMAF